MERQNILILTPVKNASRHLVRYFQLLNRLTYPKENISLGFLESDSDDDTFDFLEAQLPTLQRGYRKAHAWKKDFGYRIPATDPRWLPVHQVDRRSTLARSRNHLLSRALDDEDWVMWLDVDLLEYPADIIETLLAIDREILHPNCVLDYGGNPFDLNAWRDKGRLHMGELKAEGELVELHSVGGTLLWIKADLHRDGLIFPPFPYGLPNPLVRNNNAWKGELETEGLGMMAHDMGFTCWGLPHLEIRHVRG